MDITRLLPDLHYVRTYVGLEARQEHRRGARSLPETTSFALALHPFREDKERTRLILTGSRHTASDLDDLEFTFAGAHSAMSDS